MEKETRNYLAIAYQLFASLTLLAFVQAPIVLAQQPIQKGKVINGCLQPAEDPTGQFYKKFKDCLEEHRAAKADAEAAHQPEYPVALGSASFDPSATQAPTLIAAAVTTQPAKQQVALDTGSVTVSHGEFGISIPVSPGRMSGQDAQIYQQVVDKFACLDATQQSKLANELKAISGTAKQLEHLKMWYELNKDVPCSRKIGEEPTRYRIIEEKKDLPMDYRNVKWTPETRHDMVAFTQSHPDNAGCYGGWASAKTEIEARDMIKACVTRPDYRDKYINSIKPGVISQLFLAEDKNQFVDKLIAGDYKIVPAHRFNEVNAGLYFSHNFVEIVLGKDEAPIMVAEVEINTEGGFVYYVDLNPLCANFMLPVQDWSWSAKQELLVIGPQGPHDESLVPIITFEKKFSNLGTQLYVSHLTLNAASRSDALHVFVRSEKFHNYGKTQAYQVVVHDQPPPCLVPFDEAARQLVGPGIPIGNIAAGADGPAVAAVSEWALNCTASETQQVVDLDNLEYTTSENAARAEAHAFLTVVMPLPPPTIVRVPAPPTSCAPPASCFDAPIETNAAFMLYPGQTLKVHLNSAILGDTASIVAVSMRLDKSYTRSNKKMVGITVPVLKESLDRDKDGNILLHYLESLPVTSGRYSVRVSYKDANGNIVECVMNLEVPDKGFSKKDMVLSFIAGAAVGVGVSFLIGGVTHVATIVGPKPVGCAVNPACLVSVVTRGPVIPIP